MLKCTRDIWLSKVLNRPVYALKSSDSQEISLADLESDFKRTKQGPVFIYSKVRTDDISTIHLLEAEGFKLITTNLQFQKKLEKKPVDPRTPVRFANPHDAEAVGKIAGENFICSRFHLDPEIGNTAANAIKSEWACNFFRGKRGDAMVVAEVHGRVAGFLQLIYQGDTLVIDLIAVDKNSRGKGVAGGLISFAGNACGDFTTLSVGTQIVNGPSIRLYTGIGCCLKASYYSFHFHNN